MKQKELITTLGKYPGNKDVVLSVNGKLIENFLIQVGKEDITLITSTNKLIDIEQDKPSKKIKTKKEDETKSE